jgi:hypothetical protein
MDNEKYNDYFNFKSNNINKEKNIIVFIEEIILDIVNEKNPILIIKLSEFNILGKGIKKNKKIKAKKFNNKIIKEIIYMILK